MRHWWEADEWGKTKPMEFGKAPRGGRMRRIAVTRKLEEGKDGAFREVNAHPHTAVRVYVGGGALC